jgi:hypothetical protein
MRMVLFVVLVGCGAAPHTPAPRVRLAHDNEFPAQLQRDGYGTDWRECELAGTADRALYQPLLEYARTQLLAPDTKAGLPSSGLDIHWEGDAVQTHMRGVFDRIEIAPRSQIGRLEIHQNEWLDGRADWGMGTDYCVHVVDEKGERVFVLVPGYSTIGSVTPTRSFRAAST